MSHSFFLRAVNPGPEDAFFLDYGPLFIGLRGRTMDLRPHPIAVINTTGVSGLPAANVFRVGGSRAVAVLITPDGGTGEVTFSLNYALAPSSAGVDQTSSPGSPGRRTETLPTALAFVPGGGPTGVPVLVHVGQGRSTPALTVVGAPLDRGCVVVVIDSN
jgi:hypothetical protein